MEPNTSSDADVFTASFQGRTVTCATVDDTVTIKFAERLLQDGDAATPDQLSRAVVVLRRYGCDTAANALAGRLARLRAADHLRHSVGYVRGGARRPK